MVREVVKYWDFCVNHPLTPCPFLPPSCLALPSHRRHPRVPVPGAGAGVGVDVAPGMRACMRTDVKLLPGGYLDRT